MRVTLSQLGPTSIRAGSLFELLTIDPHDPQAVAKAIRRCPTSSARILAAVNSAAAGVRHRIESVERTIILLGASRARLIALSYGLRLLHQGAGLPKPMIDVLWSNSLQKASAAHRLASILDPTVADQAYTAALIQDIGLPSLIGVDRVFYEVNLAASTSETAWWEMERNRFGFDHAAAGQYMLLEWGASDAIQKSVLHHHRPPTIPSAVDGQSTIAIATFLGSLLPHWGEETSPHQLEWLQAIHARFLAMTSATPEQFLQEVAGDMQRLISQDFAATPVDRTKYGRRVHRLVSEVAGGAARVVVKLCRLEHALEKDQQGLRDLRTRAFTDPLTRVLNRGGFVELARRRIDEAVRRNEGICCMLSDLDGFKEINDRYGHDAGDRVLRGVAKLLRRSLGAATLIGRMGGDEFAVVMTGVTVSEAQLLGEEVIEHVRRARLRVLHGVEIRVTVSLGVVHTEPQQGHTNLDDLLKAADTTMYRRKREGKHGMTFAILGEPATGEPADANPNPLVRTDPRAPRTA